MNFYGLTFEELDERCDGANLLFNWHYKKNRAEACDHHNLSKKSRALTAEMSFALPQISTVQQSADRTVKFLFKMNDGLSVETVLIPFQGKYTICLSSQVGCAMACSFCHTGKQGFSRHLRTEEIVGQLIEAKRWLTQSRPGDDRVLNVVFMGQGEPLHNFDAVRDAAKIFISQHGLSLAPHKITVSTSGYAPGLERWKAEMPDVNIALSLHSIDAVKRQQLIPINKKYPLETILPLVENIPHGEKRFVTYEYMMIRDFNDSLEEARGLGEKLRGTKAFVNLIPFNPFPGTLYQRPDMSRVTEFKAILDSFEIPTTVRSTKGDAILAACGQLNSANGSPERAAAAAR
jgi:23S rRNA (adenine2503-C2)-methyltransferase